MKKYVIYLTLIISPLLLSGCFSLLANHQQQGNNTVVLSDEVDAVGAGKSSDNRSGWIFVGKNHTYLLSAGADSFMSALLKSQHINKALLTPMTTQSIPMANNGQDIPCSPASGTFFLTDKSGSQFSGCLAILYKKANISTAEQNELNTVGFERLDAATYLLRLTLTGTVHDPVQSSHDINKLIKLPHPVMLSFVRKDNSGVIKGLAKVADVITAPIQVLGIAAYTGYAGYRLSHH